MDPESEIWGAEAPVPLNQWVGLVSGLASDAASIGAAKVGKG